MFLVIDVIGRHRCRLHHNLSTNPWPTDRFRVATEIEPFLRLVAALQHLRKFLAKLALERWSQLSSTVAAVRRIFPFVVPASTDTTPNPFYRPIRFAWTMYDEEEEENFDSLYGRTNGKPHTHLKETRSVLAH